MCVSQMMKATHLNVTLVCVSKETLNANHWEAHAVFILFYLSSVSIHILWEPHEIRVKSTKISLQKAIILLLLDISIEYSKPFSPQCKRYITQSSNKQRELWFENDPNRRYFDFHSQCMRIHSNLDKQTAKFMANIPNWNHKSVFAIVCCAFPTFVHLWIDSISKSLWKSINFWKSIRNLPCAKSFHFFDNCFSLQLFFLLVLFCLDTLHR